jgi:transcriptional regulator with XRE-family HTH domain
MVLGVVSPATSEALQILGASVKSQRLRRKWSIKELAQRVGVSHPTIIKIERGDPSVAIGTVLEAAVLVGVPLFDADPVTRSRQLGHLRSDLALLPQAGRMSRVEADDDF